MPIQTDPIPSADADVVNLLFTLDTKLDNHQATLDLTAGDLASVHADYISFSFACLQVGVFKEEYAERVAFKSTLRSGAAGAPVTQYPGLDSISLPAGAPVAPGVERRLRALVKRIKAHKNYTEAIGQDLGIVAAPVSLPDPLKPAAKARPLPNCESEVSYLKGGFTGALVETRRNTETNWSLLGVKTRAKFVDNRPPLDPALPETRNYRLRYMNGDAPVGDWSDVVSATVCI